MNRSFFLPIPTMHFALLLKTLSVVLLGLASAARSHELSHHPSVQNDLHCTKGMHAGFIHNSYTYNAPLHEFTNITGSFFDAAWYVRIV